MITKKYPKIEIAEYLKLLNTKNLDYPESIEVTVCKGKIRFFHPSDSLITKSERELFTIGSDRVAIDGVFESANYRRVGDTASLVGGDPQRILQYTLERNLVSLLVN